MDPNQSFRPYGFGQGSHSRPPSGMPPFNPMDYACWGYGQSPYGAPPSPIPQGVYGEHGHDIADQSLEESQPAAAPREPALS
jgi:hypothetical protein